MTVASEIFTRADEHYHAQRFEKAEADYQRALSLDPSNVAGHFNLGMLRIRRGDIQGERDIEHALRQDKQRVLDSAKSFEAIIYSLISIGYKKHAHRWLTRARSEGLRFESMPALSKELDLPHYLEPSVSIPETGIVLERYAPFESKQYVFAIETVGGCNLRCPTCPVSQDVALPSGMMSPTLFQNIIQKIKSESADPHPDIWLFNWSEPLLNPNIGQFIQIVRQAGLTSFISTNLNVGHHLESVMLAAPDRLKVSISSLKQAIYSKTHVRGKISTVIHHLEKLAAYRDQQPHQTDIWIGHHLYQDTVEEGAEIAELAQRLGFRYQPSYAIMAPLEKVIELTRHPEQANALPILGNLLFDPVQIAQQNKARRSGKMDCEMRFNMTAINVDGSVNLCCGTTQMVRPMVKTFYLATPQSKIEALKYQNSFCRTCADHGLDLTIQDV